MFDEMFRCLFFRIDLHMMDRNASLLLSSKDEVILLQFIQRLRNTVGFLLQKTPKPRRNGAGSLDNPKETSSSGEALLPHMERSRPALAVLGDRSCRDRTNDEKAESSIELKQSTRVEIDLSLTRPSGD